MLNAAEAPPHPIVPQPHRDTPRGVPAADRLAPFPLQKGETADDTK